MSNFQIYPAIDLLDGEVVRLTKGKEEDKTVYGNPLEVARRLEGLVEKIHVVDLNGALHYSPKNLPLVKEIVESTSLAVQLGGGLRDTDTVSKAYSMGVENVIIGTKAFDVPFLEEVTKTFPGITVSLDVDQGKVSVHGWAERASMDLKSAYRRVSPYVDRFIYTAVQKDGTLEGVADVGKFWEGERVIYAGGVTSIADIRLLWEKGFSGAIIGKAWYEGKIGLDEALRAVDDLKC